MTQKRELDFPHIDNLIDNGLTCAIIDIDGTISKSNIGNLYFFIKRDEYGFIRWLLWYIYFILFRYPFFILLDRRDRAQAQQKIYALYRDYSPGRLEVMSKRLFDDLLVSRLFPQTIELIEYLQGRGISIILLSSNMEQVARQYATHLAVDKCYAVPLEKICGDVAPANYFAQFKERKLAQIQGAEHALIIADSFHDLPILQKTRHPVVVTKKMDTWMETLENASFVYI